MAILALVTVMGCSYGYAALSTDLLISGEAMVKSYLSLDTISDMQQMTPEVCATTEIGATKQLRDIRDGKYYWVTKLADNRCWMTQNLALDLSTTKALTPNDSDVSANWVPNIATSTSAATITNDNASQQSWNLGSYYVKNPTDTTSCGSRKSSLSDCSGQVAPLNTPTSANGEMLAHYLVGNYYSFCAATAGSCTTIGYAPDSLCPKGWELINSDGTDKNSIRTLLAAYSINGTTVANNAGAAAQAPMYFTRGGYVVNASNKLYMVGAYAMYRGLYSKANTASESFILSHTNDANNYYSNNRYTGASIRCIARQSLK